MDVVNEVGKGALLHCWWKCKLVQKLWKAITKSLRQLNIDLGIPPLGIYPFPTWASLPHLRQPDGPLLTGVHHVDPEINGDTRLA
jgi:hypothetical protein